MSTFLKSLISALLLVVINGVKVKYQYSYDEGIIIDYEQLGSDKAEVGLQCLNKASVDPVFKREDRRYHVSFPAKDFYPDGKHFVDPMSIDWVYDGVKRICDITPY
ncbi:hypothetical protein FOZ60_007663 [Perkinsus olseni]|uniref:Uncharacterized protein n=1 Tax=Perkinsus olseni TaxID=32597 RepID=A0A7J6NMD3_PEROL|nr:hypothetical protein FOZ60_007663 [Perkinsus olseni]